MSHEIRIVTEAELRDVVRLDLGAVDVVEDAFAALARGGVVMPPILSMELAEANGEVDVKTAYIPGFDGFAIKVSPGFFDNPKLGLPSLNGLMILFSARTGLVEAVFLDNGYLTDIRTAAAGAVAARHLAPETVETAGVIGTGVQARLQIEAAQLVRPFDARSGLGPRPGPAPTPAPAICGSGSASRPRPWRSRPSWWRESQLVVTTTPARRARAPGRMAASGAARHRHGLRPGRQERDRARRARRRRSLRLRPGQPVRGAPANCEAARRGGPVESGTRRNSARSSPAGAPAGGAPDEVTICDLTGTGAQDTAIATHVFARLGTAGTAIQA